MSTPTTAPIRCTSCDGTGQGELVITGEGQYRAPCTSCDGTGQH